jgi:acyl carrier protein
MSDMVEKVKDIIVEELGVEREKLTDEASFMEDLGADSLSRCNAGLLSGPQWPSARSP